MKEATDTVSKTFEDSFMAVPLEQQIAHCDRYELMPLFKAWLPTHQPILEAGSGSGRWVGWFVRQGWQATGLDWSEELCTRARNEIRSAQFVQGDMRAMPFPTASFGAIVSLGAIEHTPEGPAGSLSEYRRVLRPDGIAIITVPFLSPVRRLRRIVAAMYHLARGSGRKNEHGSQLNQKQVLKELPGPWPADLVLDGNAWQFFQYNFNRAHMRGFFHEAGFSVIHEFIDFKDEGILHNFGGICGHHDSCKGSVCFSLPGRMLRSLLPLQWVGHMLCYVVRRS